MCRNSGGKRRWARNELSRVLKVNRDERREMEGMKGLLMQRAFSGQKGRMGDCSDRSSALEAGVFQPRAVRLLKKIHLKMGLIHHSPLVINVK